MPKIIPIRELRDTMMISELCHNTEEPIFITKNGYGDMVIIQMLSLVRESILIYGNEKASIFLVLRVACNLTFRGCK